MFEIEIENLKNEYPNHIFEIIKLENPNNYYGDNNLLVIKKL